jgi:uncharacterized membrane-anchored protein YjiN (DUF445 family)
MKQTKENYKEEQDECLGEHIVYSPSSFEKELRLILPQDFHYDYKEENKIVESILKIVERNFILNNDWNEYLKENFISKFIAERDYVIRKEYERLKQEKYKLMEQVVELQEKSIEKQKVIDVLDKYVIIDYHNKKQIKKELKL